MTRNYKIVRRLLVLVVTVLVMVMVWWTFLPRAPTVRKTIHPRGILFQHLSKAKSLASEGEYREALELFDLVIREEPDSSYGWNARIFAAGTQGKLGQLDPALALINSIIANCPFKDQLPTARMVRADIRSLGGDNAGAAQEMDQLVREYSDRSARVCASALFNIARIYARADLWGLQRASLIRVTEDFRGSEDNFKKSADRDLVEMEQEIEQIQTAIADEMVQEGLLEAVQEVASGQVAWTPGGGPYLISDQLLIGGDTTLRIEAGTQVRFTISGKLRVEGTLEIEGTAEEPVRLTSLRDDVDREWWGGIVMAGSDQSPIVRLSHCHIVGAMVGIHAEAGNLGLDHCVVQRPISVGLIVSGSTIARITRSAVTESRRVGVRCDGAAGMEMQQCEIAESASDGIVVKDTDKPVILRDTTIRGSGGNGLYARGSCEPLIERGVIRGNQMDGIRGLDGANPSVVDTIIHENMGTGISMEQRWSASIRGSRILANGLGGVGLVARCSGELTDNLLEGNQEFGLFLRLGSMVAVTGNRFIGNQGPGIWCAEDSAGVPLQGNVFVNNVSSIRNESSSELDASHNWWGTTDESKIRASIEDTRQDPTFGEVRIEPWLHEAPESAIGRSKAGIRVIAQIAPDAASRTEDSFDGIGTDRT